MSERMRDEFEVECSKLGWDLTRQASASSEYYNHTVVNLCWTFWQASRAALVVELPPEREERFIDSYQEGWNDAIDSCRVRVESVGVTCK